MNMLPWYMTAEWWYLGAGACPVANALQTADAAKLLEQFTSLDGG